MVVIEKLDVFITNNNHAIGILRDRRITRNFVNAEKT
jgi:hypothetical protein